MAADMIADAVEVSTRNRRIIRFKRGQAGDGKIYARHSAFWTEARMRADYQEGTGTRRAHALPPMTPPPKGARNHISRSGVNS